MANLTLNTPVIVLCEGAADKAFLAALRTQQQLPSFDLPFPPEPVPPGKPLHGRDGFVNMLSALAVELRGDPAPITRGIVIVVDAGDDAGTTLEYVAQQCRNAGFAPPTRAGQWSAAMPPLPPVAILTVPADRPGGLESLCCEALSETPAEVAACVASFLACVPPQPRSAEKRGKAALACFTAALDDDPTMTLTTAFKRMASSVDLRHSAFAPLAESLAQLFASLPA